MYKLSIDFYNRDNVVQIAKELVGKILVTNFEGVLTSGRIVETEAYVGIADKASHSYKGRRTPRNEHMYAQGGTAYIYVCYGIHQMFNVVTNKTNVPDAILVRALEPMQGITAMLKRTNKPVPGYSLAKGPGNVGKALGFQKRYSGSSLTSEEMFIAADEFIVTDDNVGTSTRIGVNYAAEDALLPYRFYLKGNKYVSSRPTT